MDENPRHDSVIVGDSFRLIVLWFVSLVRNRAEILSFSRLSTHVFLD
jgi:hypothetical protein